MKPDIPDTAASFWHMCARLLAKYSKGEFIDHLLATLGHMHRADRAWLILYNEEGTHFWNAHEWVRVGTTAFLHDLQGTPVSLIDWLHKQMLRNEIVYIADPAHMPRQARSLRSEFLRQGNKSVLCVPIFQGDRLLGLFGYDTVRQQAYWNEEEYALLRDVATLLGELSEHHDAQQPALQAVSHHTDLVYVRMQYGLAAVNSENIVMLQSQRDYTRITYLDGSNSIELRSLKSWAQQLPTEHFIQVARGTIVHSGCIQHLQRSAAGWLLSVIGLEQKVKVGRHYRHQVRHLLGF